MFYSTFPTTSYKSQRYVHLVNPLFDICCYSVRSLISFAWAYDTNPFDYISIIATSLIYPANILTSSLTNINYTLKA